MCSNALKITEDITRGNLEQLELTIIKRILGSESYFRRRTET